MKIGDLVTHWYTKKIGIVMKAKGRDPRCSLTSSNKVFDISWQDGTIEHNVWDYDLEVVSENR